MIFLALKFYLVVCIYVILCLTVARIGKYTVLGFWGVLFVSILITPLLPGIAVFMLKPKEPQKA